jgi:hypothetical protein
MESVLVDVLAGMFCCCCFSTVRQQGQSLEKINRAMILAPLVGIVLNLRNAGPPQCHGTAYDMATVLAGVDVSAAVIANFQYLVEYSWVRVNAMFFKVLKLLGSVVVAGESKSSLSAE